MDRGGAAAGFHTAVVGAHDAAGAPGAAAAVGVDAARRGAVFYRAEVHPGNGAALPVGIDLHLGKDVHDRTEIDAEQAVGGVIAPGPGGIIVPADPEAGDAVTLAVKGAEEGGLHIRVAQVPVQLADGSPGAVLAAQVDIRRQEEGEALPRVPGVDPHAEGAQLRSIGDAVCAGGGLRAFRQLRHGPIRRVLRQLRRGRLHPQPREKAQEQDQRQQQGQAFLSVPCHS